MLPGLGALVLGGCATTTSPSGRTQFVAPAEVGAVYSEVGLQTQLALSPEAYCSDKDCESVAAFRLQVHRLGKRLGEAAHGVARELGLDPPEFIISTPTKRDIGALSSASGSLVVFDGLRRLELPEPGLAFLIAREMGHIMAQHHEENSATNIAVSVAVALLFPVAGIIQQGTSAAISSTAAGLSASVASTAISFAGSHVVKAMYRDEQLREADAYALQIMNKAGWTPDEVALALDVAALRITDGEGWLAELWTSKARVDQIVMGPVWPLPPDIASVASEAAPPSIPTRSEWLHAVARIAEPFRPEADYLIEDEWVVPGDLCSDPSLPARVRLHGATGSSPTFSETIEVSSAKRPGKRIVSRKAASLKKVATKKVSKKAVKRSLKLSSKAGGKKQMAKKQATKKRASAPPSAIRAKASRVDGRRQVGL